MEVIGEPFGDEQEARDEIARSGLELMVFEVAEDDLWKLNSQPHRHRVELRAFVLDGELSIKDEASGAMHRLTRGARLIVDAGEWHSEHPTYYRALLGVRR